MIKINVASLHTCNHNLLLSTILGMFNFLQDHLELEIHLYALGHHTHSQRTTQFKTQSYANAILQICNINTYWVKQEIQMLLPFHSVPSSVRLLMS